MSQNSLSEAVLFYSNADLLASWQSIADTLNDLQNAEQIFRREIARRFFPTATAEGVFYAQLDENRQLKLHNRLNYTFKQGDDFQKNYDKLGELIGAANTDLVVVWKASVGVRALKQLTGEARTVADNMIITKQAMPAVSIETKE